MFVLIHISMNFESLFVIQTDDWLCVQTRVLMMLIYISLYQVYMHMSMMVWTCVDESVSLTHNVAVCVQFHWRLMSWLKHECMTTSLMISHMCVHLIISFMIVSNSFEYYYLFKYCFWWNSMCLKIFHSYFSVWWCRRPCMSMMSWYALSIL
jgi:hypothetical protein